jgi:hypothetical protein
MCRRVPAGDLVGAPGRVVAELDLTIVHRPGVDAPRIQLSGATIQHGQAISGLLS